MVWHDDRSNLIALAEFLDDECVYFLDTAVVIRFFEKPWKWTREWEIFQVWRDSERDESLLRQLCVEAIEDDSMDWSDVRNEYENQGAA